MHNKPNRIKIATRQIVTTPNASAAALVRGITRSTNSTHALYQHGYKESSSGRVFTSFRGLIFIGSSKNNTGISLLKTKPTGHSEQLTITMHSSNDDKAMHEDRH
jgi:hypothetical protein